MRYIILSPPYRYNSAGIRVLHELHKQLLLIGEDAIITSDACIPEDDDVYIVPEIYNHDEIIGRRVVRYYLNKPLESVYYPDDELPITYLDQFYPGAFRLTVPSIETFFENRKQDRPNKAVFYGKCNTGYPMPECIAITRLFPETRKRLVDLLNTCSVLYTFDDTTALADEARICGCDVILVNGKEQPYTNYIPWHEDFNAQLVAFNKLVKERFA
jgi:hypothetical protein